MATAFTHAFVGATLAFLPRTTISKAKLCLVAGFLAAAPDLDVAAFRLGIPYDHPFGHRGFSHSLLFAVLVAAIVAPLLAPRRQSARVALVLAVAIASHGILDAFTDAGLGVGFFIPVSEVRFFAPWRPLATSPLGVSAFFSGPAVSILFNELTFVWVPAILGVLLWRYSARAA